MSRFSFDEREFNLVESVDIPSGTIISITWVKSTQECPNCHFNIVKSDTFNLDNVAFWLSDDSTVESCSLDNLIVIGKSGNITLKLDAEKIQEALQLSTLLQGLIA